MTLENELSRYFKSVEATPLDEYSFDAFDNLLQNDPKQILILLEEIRRVHDETVEALDANTPDEAGFKSLVHKVKGGAQLLQAKNFTEYCLKLEKDGPLPARIISFQKLLAEQNQTLEAYQARYRNLA